MKIKIIVLIFSIVMINSCEYLNYEEVAVMDEEYVFTERISRFINSIYSSLPGAFNWIDNGMIASASDEAEHAWNFSEIQNFNIGNWNPYYNPDNAWGRLYAAIRKTDLFLYETENVTFEEYKLGDPPSYEQMVSDLVLYRAEARFLKAFFYFELAKRFGDVIILKRNLTLTDNLEIPRDSYDDCVELIIANCDAAIKDLPVTRRSEHLGRATKGAAYALKCRTYLYAASPLHNNGSYNLALCDSAAKYANEIFKLTPDRYDLHRNYNSLFRSRRYNSKELIFERRFGSTNSFERANYPVGYEGGGEACTCPSQNLVDAYEMQSTGLPITDPASGYDPANPYNDRDPRLAMTIIFNNVTFKDRPVECYTGGLDGPPKIRGTKTGYYLLKMIDANINFLTNTTSTRHTWYYFRLGEIYLNYAEAMNEISSNPYAPGKYNFSVAEAVNKIRTRVGMPDARANLTQSQMRDLIRNERRVELAFEEHRFWDVRRWMIAESTLGAPLRGMRITKTGDNTFTYEPYVVENRVFQSKMYYYPIPEMEILNNPKSTQNEGW